MLATIDVLSKGRVILGAGVGWLREEFEALGAPPFEERGPVTDEYIRLMRAAWTTDPVTFEGQSLLGARHPRAARSPRSARHPDLDRRPHGAALRRAGTLGDGWHPIAHATTRRSSFPDEYAAKAEQVRDCGARGRTRPESRSR